MKVETVSELFRETADVIENLNEISWAVGDEHECLEADPDYWFSVMTEDFFGGPVYDEQRHRNLRLFFGRQAHREAPALCEGTTISPHHATAVLRLSAALSFPNRRLLWSLGVDDMVRLALLAESHLLGE